MTPAYEHNGRPCTREAFYAIACDPRRHVAVEACAGAGKTWMLVSRMLRALLDGSAPHEILAITFTKKAAGEMRQRLREWLQDFARPRPARPDQGQPAETEADWLARLDKELVSRGIEPKSATSQRQQLQNLYASVLGGTAGRYRSAPSTAGSSRCSSARRWRCCGSSACPRPYELLEDDADAVAEVWRRYLRTLAGDAGLSADYHALVAQLGRHTAHQALEAALARRVEFQLADAAGHVEEAVAAAGAMVPELAAFAHPADALLTDAARTRWQAWARELGAEKNKTPQNAAAAVIDAFEAQADGPQRLAALRKAFFVADEDRLSKNLQKFPAAQRPRPSCNACCPPPASTMRARTTSAWRAWRAC
jgi:ATP-dependent helicase/nuclease subunit A